MWLLVKQARLRERREKMKSMVLVGMDSGEWMEMGRVSTFSKAESSVLPSGERAQSKVIEKIGYKSMHMGETAPGVRRKNPYKVNHRVVGLDGAVSGTRLPMQGKRKRSPMQFAEDTRLDGGMVVGWDTRVVPNRYDYYLEGHWINRGSKAMAKLSKESKEGNR